MAMELILNGRESGVVMKDINDRISIVMPVYNSSSYIERTLCKLMDSQDVIIDEIILVDDQSSDFTKLESIAKKFNKVKIIKKKKKSNAAISRNIGILESQNNYIFLIDSDDHVLPNYFNNRLNYMKENDFGIVFGSFYEVTDDDRNLIHNKYLGDMRDYLFVKKSDFRTSTISINKKFYIGTEFDPLQYKHQDWGFGIRCDDACEKIGYDDTPGVDIIGSRATQMSSSMNIEASNYFINKYLVDKKYLKRFIELHYTKAFLNNDLKAIKFFHSFCEVEVVGFLQYIKYNFIFIFMIMKLSTILRFFYFVLKKQY